MIIYNFLVLLINEVFIKGMFMSVLVVVVAGKLLKNDSVNGRALNILRWIMVTYAVLAIVFYLAEYYISYFSGGEYTQYSIKRTTGPYWYAFWLIAGSNTALPLFLLIPQLSRKAYFILLIAVFMNIGWLMEFLTLHYNLDGVPYTDMWLNLLRGVAVGVLALFAGNITTRKTQPAIT